MSSVLFVKYTEQRSLKVLNFLKICVRRFVNILPASYGKAIKLKYDRVGSRKAINVSQTIGVNFNENQLTKKVEEAIWQKTTSQRAR